MKKILGFLFLDLNGKGLTALHYLVGGILGVIIAKLLYGELSLPLEIFSFLAWPVVFAFSFFVLTIKIIVFIISLIF